MPKMHYGLAVSLLACVVAALVLRVCSPYLARSSIKSHREGQLHEEPGLFSRLKGVVFSLSFLFSIKSWPVIVSSMQSVLLADHRAF